MSYFNSVVLIGNLGKDPEVLKKEDDSFFVRIQMATTKKYKDAQGEVREDTQWHTVYFNNGTAKFVSKYVKTGTKVLVRGELRKQKWTNKAGQTQYLTAVFAQECKILSKKSDPKEEADLPIEDNKQEARLVELIEKVLEKKLAA